MSGYILIKTYNWVTQAALYDVLEVLDINNDNVDGVLAARIFKTSSAFFEILKNFKR
jgi:hypothetical protein